jgi:hypothetical protein
MQSPRWTCALHNVPDLSRRPQQVTRVMPGTGVLDRAAPQSLKTGNHAQRQMVELSIERAVGPPGFHLPVAERAA